MQGLIKIGRTRRDSRARARELFKTGVPTPFQVAFEIFSVDYALLEKNIHKELNDYRVSNNREFFKYPLNKAIYLLQSLNSDNVEDDAFQAIDITNQLQVKYGQWLKKDIVSVRIVQPKERVWLEITQESETAGYLIDQTIKRSDLGFVTDGDEEEDLFLSPDVDVIVNADKFINDFDPFSIINTTDLFHEEGAIEVNERYNPHKV